MDIKGENSHVITSTIAMTIRLKNVLIFNNFLSHFEAFLANKIAQQQAGVYAKNYNLGYPHCYNSQANCSCDLNIIAK